MEHLESQREEIYQKHWQNYKVDIAPLAMFTTMKDHALFMKNTVWVKKSHIIQEPLMQQFM